MTMKHSAMKRAVRRSGARSAAGVSTSAAAGGFGGGAGICGGGTFTGVSFTPSVPFFCNVFFKVRTGRWPLLPGGCELLMLSLLCCQEGCDPWRGLRPGGLKP